MNQILFSILVLINCPSDVAHKLERHAIENNCTVEELMTEIITDRLCGNTNPSIRMCDECMQGHFKISQRDEEAAGKGIIVEHVVVR